MKGRMLHLYLPTLFLCLLAVALSAQTASADNLSLNKGNYIVGVGQTADGLVKFVGGGRGTNDDGGYMTLGTTNTSIATVTPTYVPFVINPALGYINMDVPFTLNGVQSGSTIIQVKAYDKFGVNFLTVSANVNVIGIPCPATVSLESSVNEQSDLATLYRFRDQVLADKTAGKVLTKLYYRNAWEISFLMLRHSNLLDQSRALAARFLPDIQALNDGGQVTLSKADRQEVNHFLNDLAGVGSPRLRSDLETVRKIWNSRRAMQSLGVELQ